jgi:hypothetical protein
MALLLQPTYETDQAPNATPGLETISDAPGLGATLQAAHATIPLDGSAQLAARSSGYNGSVDVLNISTRGAKFRRGITP